MNEPTNSTNLVLFLKACFPMVEAQPPEAKPELLEGFAMACGENCPELRDSALAAAHDLRQAAASQLHLRELLK
jgi:hypothetical protein